LAKKYKLLFWIFAALIFTQLTGIFPIKAPLAQAQLSNCNFIAQTSSSQKRSHNASRLDNTELRFYNEVFLNGFDSAALLFGRQFTFGFSVLQPSALKLF
jgi:hypothetical protein